MVQREVGFLIQVVKMGVVSGCVLGLLAGCSSQLRTTITSASEPPKLEVTQLEPEVVVDEEVVARPGQKETRMDIPVEEPARPALRSKLPAEIFATAKTPDVPSDMTARAELEPSLPTEEEPVVSSLPLAPEPTIQQPAVGIPPIAFEPEMPAVPSVPQDEGPVNFEESPIAVAPSSEEAALAPQPEEPAHEDISPVPAPPAAPEPMQTAKVMPEEMAQTATITKTLETALNDIYFDYDRFTIRDDAMALLKANAKLLSGTLAEKKIVIEGHCDERGTQSYNMVLGERRAKAAKQFLADLGVPTDNLQVMSYGKDKPFCMEHTEKCFQENRRGHFVIK
ncbi:MAG: OmpA family protein [Nitrospirales bacterium]